MPSKSQNQTPILDILKQLAQKPHAAFYAPGHKQGKGTPNKLLELLGKDLFKADLPELPELDNLFAPSGAIKAAQELAAAAFGADRSWFLVNGSTCGIQAAILATCKEGEKIILPRNIHQSAIAGLILSGAMPVWIEPEYDREFDLFYSITPEAVKIALEQHQDAKGLMLVYPTYQGVCGDLAAISKITQQYNIPLLVDEAHGAHFHFHGDLPPSALSLGADLSVQSTHKVLGAMTQASMLHLKGKRIDRDRISQALQILETTSPSYILLASLDAARQQMALYGKELLAKTIELGDRASNEISQITNLSVLNSPDRSVPGFTYSDRTRLTVNISKLGITGFEVDEILHQKMQVTAELPLDRHLTFIISIGNTESDIEQLVKSLKQIANSPALNRSEVGNLKLVRKDRDSGQNNNRIKPLTPDLKPNFLTSDLTPRQAYFAEKETVSREKAIDRLSGELICPYPPGIPILMPGEKITSQAIAYLVKAIASGAKITGCSDSSLKTLKILR